MPAVLFALAYILRTYRPNLGQVTAAQLGGPLLAATLLAATLTALMALRLEDRRRGELLGLAATMAVLWPAPFVGAFEALAGAGLDGAVALAGAALAAALPLLVLGAFLGRQPPGATGVRRLYDGATFAAAYLLVTALWPLRSGVPEATRAPVRLRTLREDPTLTKPPRPPNIYWIVLDAYTRADVLRDTFGYDNAPFLDQLRSRGFQVAEAASANYATTLPSLASALNWDHLDPDPVRAIPGKLAYYAPLINRVRGNRTVRVLGALGYHRTVHSSGNYAFAGWEVEATHEPMLGSSTTRSCEPPPWGSSRPSGSGGPTTRGYAPPSPPSPAPQAIDHASSSPT